MTERLGALAAVLKAEPAVGWNLLQQLLPGGRDTTTQTTHLPRWRPWADGWSREIQRRECAEYLIAIANLAIDAAGTDCEMWAQILDGILRVSAEITKRAMGILERLSKDTQSSPEKRFLLWIELRTLLGRHERYSDAKWAFKPSLRKSLKAIRDRLEPTDPLLRYVWLFDSRAELPDVDICKDVAAHDEALYQRRLAALEQIVAHHGTPALFTLIDRDADGGVVGWIAGAMDSIDWQAANLPAILDSASQPQVNFACNFIANRFRRFSWAFIGSLPIRNWTELQVASVARCLPCRPETWTWLEQFGPGAVSEYWSRVRPFLRDETIDDVRSATAALIAVGRAFSAIDLLHSSTHHKLLVPSDLIADVLETGLGPKNTESLDRSGGLRYDVEQLVKLLQDDAAFPRDRLARIEWGFLAFLDREHSRTEPSTLTALVESDAAFFVELLTKVYRARKEETREKPLDEQGVFMARNARRLLDGLSRLPGTGENGAVDLSFLRQWIQRARQLAADCDRSEVCDIALAHLCVHALQKRQEDWPAPEMAAFIEEIGSDGFFSSFCTEVMNSRGVTVRDPMSGGDLERDVAARYRRLADRARPTSLRLAEAFLRLARHYEADAHREDDEAERRRLGR